MNKKRIVGVALAVGACGVLAAAGMMLSKKSGAVVLDQAGKCRAVYREKCDGCRCTERVK